MPSSTGLPPNTPGSNSPKAPNHSRKLLILVFSYGRNIFAFLVPQCIVFLVYSYRFSLFNLSSFSPLRSHS